MMTRIQYLLGKLSEECHEVGQRAIKAQHFGHDEVQVGQGLNNIERLNVELNDLLAIVELLNDELISRDHPCKPLKGNYPMIQTKREKLQKYYELSKSRGQVE